MKHDVSLLHLSDLHFEAPAAFQDDAKANVPAALRVSAFRNLHQILRHCFGEEQLAAVVVSGDLTTRGSAKGFDSFERETAPLLRKLVTDPTGVCLVPGNHDVAWSLKLDLPDYFTQKFARYRESVLRLGVTSSLIPTGPVPADPFSGVKFSEGHAGPVYVNDARGLVVVCLNSSMRCGELNPEISKSLGDPVEHSIVELDSLREAVSQEKSLPLVTARHYLNTLLPKISEYALFDVPHVTQAQLEVVRDSLMRKRDEMKDRWTSYIKIGVLHHHVVPFDYQRPEYKPFELLLDAAAVLETLAAFGVQIVLTGHKHQPYMQRAQFGGSEMLVIGGSTVGGYPVPGFSQAIRHLRITREDHETQVAVADLPCDWKGDVETKAKELLEAAGAQLHTLRDVQPKRPTRFPARIESAVDHQLYSRAFYKTDVAFDVRIDESDDGTAFNFTTSMSYAVVNRSPSEQTWNATYEFDVATGKVLECRVNGRAINASRRQFRSLSGLAIPIPLGPNERADFSLTITEQFPARGTVMYTSYFPATDLRVVVRSVSDSCELEPIVLYSWTVWPVVDDGRIEVTLDKGLLPYQGVRINFRLKEARP